MFIPSIQGAAASTANAAPVTLPDSTTPIPPEQVRHLLFGTPSAIKSSIQHLHKLGYAEPNDWSRPLSTGRPNEVMAILTKRVGP
ncbi:MAG: hypothetical protein ACFB16_14290 [Phormidesmis sp.]